MAPFPSPWLQGFRPVSAPRRTLICFPYAGAGAAVFRDWASDVGPDTELLAVRLPGRESRIGEPPLRRAEDAVSAILDALHPLGDRPLILFGHSLGAALAYATARALVARGCPPALLVVSGRRAPHLPSRRLPSHALDDEAFRTRLIALGGTPPEVLACDELMELMLPMLRADFVMSDGFHEDAPSPIPVPILAFAGVEDNEATVEEVSAWEQVAGAAFALCTLPGGHFFLHENRSLIASQVQRSLFLWNRRQIVTSNGKSFDEDNRIR
ncbi:medium-chain acyl-[acyl-carrier-protein] hydrolase [Azospirillum brasilense]|uniref:Medium-chain acyl-[acyl-carrier-protein] hydrolase n=1 Tax=Azospirillum brasilense TaxID=192 RepID=A0A560BIP6_AZOBR|nr:alpha/beta fold hydrolase [Azospirillum brasilense]TWA72498.1 medium-chain acyl-[acyl-carrier-protein] hydrolase [Azospirillum brasilense]